MSYIEVKSREEKDRKGVAFGRSDGFDGRTEEGLFGLGFLIAGSVKHLTGLKSDAIMLQNKTILWGGVQFPTGSKSLRKARASERVRFPYRRYSPERKRMFRKFACVLRADRKTWPRSFERVFSLSPLKIFFRGVFL